VKSVRKQPRRLSSAAGHSLEFTAIFIAIKKLNVCCVQKKFVTSLSMNHADSLIKITSGSNE
jgi:hypothetical protein